ncbi:phospholipase B1, membrane-associated isoform X2 [Eurytemora carolleeae]|uniref:phospholipase B1, membrane-associated isoform X2 n=1 Tax=Eurytemora carolleeae TaxID=1294199 RepID=UPI000C785C58|nr:phospholipase B1, membrane-associated isoform X2 [Eurytemora carolleeae]|eukprot:XP_023322393.1 phospholipase B1, membrane-associated-like isoform X2 [Eurytemora affinis]
MKSAFKNFFFLLILYYFRRNLELGLEILSLMPRTIVVLVGNPDFSRLQVLKDRSLHCATYLSVLCSCLSSNTVNRFKWLVYSFNNVLKNIAHSPRFQRADFTVEYVPAATNLLNRVSQNMFALDCLHYNKATQNQLGVNLWNNLVEDPAWRTSNYGNKIRIKCPKHRNPFISTKGNSKL